MSAANKGSTHYWDELHFARFNLEWLTDGRDSLGVGPLPLTDAVRVGTKDIPTKNPPKGLKVDETMGLMMVNAVDGQVVHRTNTRILETRATITPKGDYLLMFPEGDHYAKSKGEKINAMMACRSSDKGRTWSAPKEAFDIPYGQHGFIPLTPRGTKRIYAFGTQPIPGKWTWENGQRENAPIGYRWSDDDGHTWSDVKLIAPRNDPDFKGMSVMRMTETDAGTWIVGSHLADWSVKPFTTRQYILRSEDRGETWTVLPGARPNGWIADGFDRMDEGARSISVGAGCCSCRARRRGISSPRGARTMERRGRNRRRVRSCIRMRRRCCFRCRMGRLSRRFITTKCHPPKRANSTTRPR